MPDLPADLPTNWTQGQIISPNGTEVGLTAQHGYNYLMEQVNAAQTAVNAAQGAIDAINQALGSVAQESTLQGVATDVEGISGLIGATADTGGSTTAGSVMGKLNQLVGSAGLSGFQEFTTPGAFSFTVPAGVTLVSLTACGGGGGGAAGVCSNSSGSLKRGGGGGGGGAAVFGKKVSVTPGQTISGTVGAGGAGGTFYVYGYNASSNGASGGATIIGEILTLAGGGGCLAKSDLSSISFGGVEGGEGGGRGGNGGAQVNQQASNGGGGVWGPGGKGANGIALGGGGGGGSIGLGGNGSSKNSDTTEGGNLSSPGNLGGGGGGGFGLDPNGETSGGNGADGGDGYVKFSWGVCMD